MKFFLHTLLFTCITLPLAAQAEKQPANEKEKFSYAVGVQFAQTIARQNVDLDVDSFLQAMRDVITGAPLKLDIDAMRNAMNSYQEKEMQRQKSLGDKNRAEGEKFLAENRNKEGVVNVPGGLQYKIIKEGTGEKPLADSTVLVHYRGTLLDGKEFDSSYGRGEPLEIDLNRVIKGWQIALPMMPVGSKWQLFIPSQLGYGPGGAGGDIGPNATLIFEIELLSIK